MGFTVAHGKIVAIDVLYDPEPPNAWLASTWQSSMTHRKYRL